MNILNFDIMHDEECACGSLIALESLRQVPFDIKRVFYIYGVDSTKIRGAHAHHQTNQLLICVHGHCEIILDDGENREMIMLDSANKGLLQPAMVWGEMQRFSKDAVLMVLADTLYDPKDYIRHYNDFQMLVNNQ